MSNVNNEMECLVVVKEEPATLSDHETILPDREPTEGIYIKQEHQGAENFPLSTDVGTNLGETPKLHHCTICRKSFGTRSNLTRHVRTVHEGQREHLCTVCDTSYYIHSTKFLICHLR